MCAAAISVVLKDDTDYLKNLSDVDYHLVYFDLEATGLRVDDQIVQIGACVSENETFSVHAIPSTRDIPPRVSEIIGIKIQKTGSQRQLVRSDTGTIVPSVTESEALSQFMSWLSRIRRDFRKILLISHGTLALDIYLIIEALRRHYMIAQFKAMVVGFCDSFILVKNAFPGRFQSHSLTSLSHEVLNLDNVAHDALDDARCLQKLVTRLGALHHHTEFVQSCYTLASIEELVTEKVQEFRRMGTLFRMFKPYRDTMHSTPQRMLARLGYDYIILQRAVQSPGSLEILEKKLEIVYNDFNGRAKEKFQFTMEDIMAVIKKHFRVK